MLEDIDWLLLAFDYHLIILLAVDEQSVELLGVHCIHREELKLHFIDRLLCEGEGISHSAFLLEDDNSLVILDWRNVVSYFILDIIRVD
jgi:hypothetical protein